MTVLFPSAGADVDRIATRRHYLMCPPEHFEVSYAINPWMDVSLAVDRGRALAQWEALRQTYVDLGHEVDVIAPVEGLPDMVFAANGGLVVGNRALGARFTHPERQPEGPAYLSWFHAAVEAGILDTHGSTIRLAPPLVVTPAELDWAVEQLAAVLRERG